MNSELNKKNSFKLLAEEQEQDFFRIPEMPAKIRFFHSIAQSKADILEARIKSSLRAYQSAGNMLDMFFGGMFNTAIGMSGGEMITLRKRKRLSPDMDLAGKYR